MDQDFINYVQIVLDEKGISNAAKRLNISQPALSARIKKIEEDFGITIFNKNRRPAALTDEGRRYLEFIGRTQQLEKSFRQYITDSKELRTGDLRIGGTHVYTQCILPRAVSLFSKKYPGINLKVVNASAPVMTGMTSKGELDLFITSSGKNSQGIIYESLIPTRLVLCVPGEYEINKELKDYAFTVEEMAVADDELIKKKSLDMKRLEDCPFILLEENQLMGRVMRDMFRKFSVGPENILHTDQAVTGYAMTGAGVGVSLMFDRTVREIYSGENVCFYTIDDDEMAGEIRVAYADQEYVPKVVTEFIKCIRETL